MLQENHYYAFGMSWNGDFTQPNASENKYLYNGKELNTDFDLNWLDYGARYYDPTIGRWNAIDPLAEMYYEHSSYHHVLNNPIGNFDPNGMKSESFIDDLWNNSGSGSTTWTNDGHGSFSDGNGNTVEAGEEEEEYCPGMGIGAGIVKMQNAKSLSEITGESYESTYLGLSKDEGNATLKGMKEGAAIMVGEWVIVKVLQGGKLVWTAIQIRRATNSITPLARGVGNMTKLLKPQSTDDVVTLFIGTSGTAKSEATGNIVFFTDNARAAASYVKNGGKVVQARVSANALYDLQARNMLTVFNDSHKGISHTSFQFTGADLKQALISLAK